MKITTNNLIKNYPDLRIHTKENYAPSATQTDGHSFDALIIQSDRRQIEEHTFAESVSRQLSSEAANTASPEKIQNLKNQIAEHTYQIDAQAIASRILLV
ncbi:MAG: flagellar biosynthesis anti-sigma factor FlgM [Ruminococcus sp.]|nr:flagellar biosynthesis anti-sigma factor FlgM [Ruminococcus sp.]